MYMQLLQKLRDLYASDKIAEGTFGAMMQVSLVNDVRLILDDCELLLDTNHLLAD